MVVHFGRTFVFIFGTFEQTLILHLFIFIFLVYRVFCLCYILFFFSSLLTFVYCDLVARCFYCGGVCIAFCCNAIWQHTSCIVHFGGQLVWSRVFFIQFLYLLTMLSSLLPAYHAFLLYLSTHPYLSLIPTILCSCHLCPNEIPTMP